ncbi:MAG: acyl-ACP--UDP-N-acetylglucosamine O-acyltransferase [Bacteroidota bacterium]|nr:acyl-ACP--UDP-N-acetylglucosamine O-acyltransferase [Bacteroidota bacterium]
MNQPLAYVHPDAKIASNVVIEPFVNISKNVEIGEGCWIGQNATIMENVKIGNNCSIFPGAVIGAIPQDLKYRGEKTSVVIGDNNTLREFVTVNRGTAARNVTKIGDNNLLMAYTHIAHDCIIGNNIIMANAVQLAGEVQVDDWAIISGTSAVHQFVHIGVHSILAGGSLVGKDVPPYTKAGRYPLTFSGVNSIGLRRRNFTNKKINEIQEIYRKLFNNGMNRSQAIDYIEAEMKATKERDEIILFVRNSKRGIIRGYFDE